jgi:hypothetical protein
MSPTLEPRMAVGPPAARRQPTVRGTFKTTTDVRYTVALGAIHAQASCLSEVRFRGKSGRAADIAPRTDLTLTGHSKLVDLLIRP